MSELVVRQQKSTRNYSLDILRIVAIFFVVMIHSSSKFIENLAGNEAGYIIGDIFNVFARPGVPLFLMISGALNLDERKEKSVKDYFRSSLNILVLLVIWSAFYAFIYNVVFPLRQGNPVVLTKFLKAALLGNYHLWYMYMLIGLYIATPFLRSFVKKDSKNLVNLYIIITLVVQFIRPVIKLLAKTNDDFHYINTLLSQLHMDFFAVFIAYYLVGWYIVHVGIKQEWIKKLIYVAGAVSVLSALLISLATKDIADTHSTSGLFIFIYSVSIFVFVNDINLKNIEKSKKIIVTMSSLSFGVYIIHAMINGFVYTWLAGLHPAVHISLQFIIVSVSSFAICFVMSKIPVVKKSIRG